MDLIYLYGDIYQEKFLKEIKNPFWNDSIRSLLMLTKQQVYYGFKYLLTIPLWYYSNMG